MSGSMAEEWEKWIAQESGNIQIVTERIEELTRFFQNTDNFQYREFWDKANEIPQLFESLVPFPPNEKERLQAEYEHICNQMKKKQQREWQDRRAQSVNERQFLEQKIDQALSIAKSAPEDIKALTKAQGLLKEALASLKNSKQNSNSDSVDYQPTPALLREDKQICWDKWHTTNDFVHNVRLAIWNKNLEVILPKVQAAIETAESGNSHQALDVIKKVQQQLKGMTLSKEHRDEIRTTLNQAWDTAIFKVNEIREESRRKYEEWLNRMETQFKDLSDQFQANQESVVQLQDEVEQFKEAIQSIKSREYGDKLRDEIAKKREKIKELEVINRQLEKKIESVKARLDDQNDGVGSPPRQRKSSSTMDRKDRSPKSDQASDTSQQTAFVKEVEKMKIKWLGHASFLLTGNDGTTVITDPYGQYDGLNYDPINETANIVLVSHQHGDHLGGNIEGNPLIIDKTGVTNVRGIDFKGVASYHDQAGGTQRGENIIFCFEMDGITLCHLGDLGHVLSDEQVRDIGSVDVLMIPVGGFFTIDANEATQVCDQIKPKVVIPMHVRNSKCAFPISPVDDFLQGKTNVDNTGTSEREFIKTALPQSMTITVFEPAK